MSESGADKQGAATAAVHAQEVASDVLVESGSGNNSSIKSGSSELQNGQDDEPMQSEGALQAKATEQPAVSPTATAEPEQLDEEAVTYDSARPTEATVTAEPTPTTSRAAIPQPLDSKAEDSARVAEKPEAEMAADDDDDTDFVPPDMEHIVSTGAAQDSASSMQALRELVAQARASTGQPRETLPPGFGDDDEEEASSTAPTQAQRGEKRKAGVELEELVQSSAGIEEVKAAAEKSQHPETKTLLQKALSSISGLVSRRPKTDAAAATTSTAQPERPAEQAQAAVTAETDSSDDSDSDSDSDSSSSDSSDDDDDDEDEAPGTGSGMALVEDDDDDDEEGGGPSGSVAPATKNEILAPDVEQPNVKELAEAEKQTLRKLGKVHSIVDSVVVVEQDVQQSKQPDSANAGPVPVDSTGRQGEREGEYSVLDTGSLLAFEDGKVLGFVFETFGSIHNPMYSIRFASAAAIDRDVVEKGKAVFYLPAQSTYVLTQLLRSMKGSDASNMWDEEVAEDEIDYSDDEQEADAKRRAKAIRSGKVDEQGNPIGAASNRGNKRQKQNAGQPSQPNGSFHQRTGPSGGSSNGYVPGQHYSNRGTSNPSTSQPKRNVGGPQLPLPPAPAGPASLGPAFPHGMASLPPKPSAGLPSRPTFQAEASSSSNRMSSETSNGDSKSYSNVAPDSQPAAPRSRMGTAEGMQMGQGLGRMHIAAASSLPAKPVDAVAAAAAVSTAAATNSATTKAGAASSPYRAQAGVIGVGVASPPLPSRPAAMGRSTPAPAGTYSHQGSPGWYGGSGSAPPSAPASPAQPSGPRGAAYSPGTGAPAVQGGHYNPAYVAQWQQHYAPGSTAGPPTHPAAAMPWNAPQAYHPPPLHMVPGSMSQQPSYGGYGGAHGGYGAPAGAAWHAPVYPGSHYPGYGDASASNQHYRNTAGGHANQGHYNPSAHDYGHGAYAGQTVSADAYSGYSYSAPAQHAATPAATAATAASAAAPAPPSQDSYDPRSPSMGSSGNNQNQQGC